VWFRLSFISGRRRLGFNLRSLGLSFFRFGFNIRGSRLGFLRRGNDFRGSRDLRNKLRLLIRLSKIDFWKEILRELFCRLTGIIGIIISWKNFGDGYLRWDFFSGYKCSAYENSG